MSLPLIDTRPLFRPLSDDLVTLLRSLQADDWLRPTVAGAWRVRDVVAHLTDTTFRRLSLHRDGVVPAGSAPANDADLAALINSLNTSWVHVAARLSPRVLTDLYATAGSALAEFMQSLDLQCPARWPVSWVGQAHSPQWLDIGREFTEVWHHGAQIRDAVQAGPFAEPRWLRAVLDIAMHALPVAYRHEPAPAGTTIVIHVIGRSGGTWTIVKTTTHGWDVEEGGLRTATTSVTLSDETAWRLLFNGLAHTDRAPLIQIEGDPAFAAPFERARAIVM